MAKVHKITMYVVDYDGDCDDITDEIDRIFDRYSELSANQIEAKSSKEFEWEDEIDINQKGCTKEQYEAYL